MHIEESFRALLTLLLLLQRCDFWPLRFPHKTLLPSHKKINKYQDVGEFYLPKLELTDLWYSLEDLVWLISDVLVLSIYQTLCYTVAKLSLSLVFVSHLKVSQERISTESTSERGWMMYNQQSV